MRYLISFFVFCFICFNGMAQLPIGVPTQKINGWAEANYYVPDSGAVAPKRDTLWVPRFPGTMVTWYHAGVDTAVWFWNSSTWNKLANAGNVITQNIANASLRANGTYLQNWNHDQLLFDTVNWFQVKGFENDATFSTRKTKYTLKMFPDFSALPLDFSIQLRNVANNADSLNNGFFVSGNITTLSAIAAPASGTLFAQAKANANSGAPNVDIRAANAATRTSFITVFADSIDVSGAVAAATADSIFAFSKFKSATGSNKLLKIPIPVTGGAGTLTSVGLTMPTAFTVTSTTANPITTNGTFNVTANGTSLQYIKGNGVNATTDTSMIPDFFTKVRSLISGTSPITYNSFTGVIGINNANVSGTKGAATFNNGDFTDDGAGLISLSDISDGGCVNCQLTILKGRVTSFSNGSAFSLANAAGAGDTLVVSGDTIKRLNIGFGLSKIVTQSSITHAVDTSKIATKHYIDSSITANTITVSNGLTKTGNNIKWGGILIDPVTDVDNSGNSLLLHGTGSNVLRTVNGAFQSNISTSSISAQLAASNSSTNKFSEVNAVEGSAYIVGGKNGAFYNQINADSDKVFLTTKVNTTPHKLILDTLGQIITDAYTSVAFTVNDTTAYKPDVVDVNGKHWRMTGWPGGGGGSGGITQLTGPVTAGPGSGSVATSITNNAITNAMIDTFYTYPKPSTLGQIYYDSAFSSVTDFLPSGGPTLTLSNAKIAVTNATSSDAAQVAVKKYRATNLHFWTFRARARATNPVVGFGPGIMSIYSGENSGFHVYVATTGATGFFMRSAISGTTLASGAGPIVNTNDILEFVITRADSVVTATVRNVTTSSSTFSISKTYTAVSGGTLIPNDGYMHWVSFADNFEIISQQFSSSEIKTPTGMILGDSKSDGYYTGTFTARYWTTINLTYPNVVLEAGESNKLSGAFNKIDELYALNPEWIVIADLGRNDLAAGTPLLTVENQYADLVTRLSRNGSTIIYHIVMPEDTTAGGTTVGLTNFKNWIQSTYGANYISGVWDTLSTSNVLKAGFNSGDNIHPNAAGNAAIATKLINSGLLTTISPKRRAPYITNDGFVTYTGNTVHATFQSQRVPNYLWKSDTSNNLVPSLIHDDGTQLVISNNPITQTIGISAALLSVDGAIYTSGLNGVVGIRDRTTTDVFGNIAQGGIFQLLVNGSGKWFLDNNGLMAVGVNPAITARSRGILNVWEDRSFNNNNQGTKGLGFNLDSNTYTGNNNTTTANINNFAISPMKIQGTGSTTYNNPSSLYIEAPPYAGASATVNNPWALNINSGNVRLGAADSVGVATGGFLYRDAATGKVGITQATSATTLYSGDGTLAGNRSVSGGANTLQLGTTGSKISTLTSNVSSAFTINSDSKINLFGAFILNNKAANDADYTVTATDESVRLPAISANRTVTINFNVADSGKILSIYNDNNSANTWNIGTAVITAASGATFSFFENQTHYLLQYIGVGGGTSQWRVLSFEGYNPVRISSSNVTMAYSIYPRVEYIAQGTTSTYTLPTVSSSKTGFTFSIKNQGSGAVTINSNGGGNDIYNTSATNTYSLASGASVNLMFDGTYFNIK